MKKTKSNNKWSILLPAKICNEKLPANDPEMITTYPVISRNPISVISKSITTMTTSVKNMLMTPLQLQGQPITTIKNKNNIMTKTRKMIRLVKTLPLAFTLALTSILISCDFVKKQSQSIQDTVTEHTNGNNTSNDETSTPHDAFIFVKDQSGSIKTGGEQDHLLKMYLKKLFYTQFKPETDIVLMQVDNFSGAPANHTLFVYEDPKTGETENSGESETVKEFERQGAEKREMTKMEQNFYKKFFADPSGKKSNRTCILDIIPLIQKQVAGYRNIHLYICSDMLEDSNYRILLGSSMNSRNVAQKMAEEDLAKLENKYGKLPANFSTIKSITVIIPQKTYSENVDIIPFYWQQIFTRMGFTGQIKWERPS
ncbi:MULTISPECIES: hypothetical protein [unclassified Chryseobacterium]|uniref:hypothetical protein n=1 Tax=unclassified Chryseobacterium TaxID=2593645 RepID=UPI000D3B46EE|nr:MULTISPECIES: hypothetical protein [unclassified Chryseobacterium]PTT72592.1 hypothetical protein DBR25_14315 [Chryseobacterium sp. HMWF001]PVV50413.1 hypothetical protein DD829_22375 [Chryseobacterium sp. HMWF035]